MLVEMGEADGMVLGAYYTSADALRPALQLIKGKQGKMVVGSMLIDRDDNVINICEMKFSQGEYELTEKYDLELRNKICTFQAIHIAFF